MIKNNDFPKSSMICVGRGATAIYLALLALDKPKTKVIVPGNLCYAAIYPVLYANMKPMFCDVDRISGNVSFDNVTTAYDEDTTAVIIPHMYGNPVIDMIRISEFCKMKGILLIQDCASAMGISPIGYNPHDIADITIYSTGHSKTIDLNGGGILEVRNSRLPIYKAAVSKLPAIPKDAKIMDSFVSKLYRLIRSTKDNRLPVVRGIIENLPLYMKDYLIFDIPNEEKIAIMDALEELPIVVERRRNKKEVYDRELERYACVQRYQYVEGAVPWRYNILVEPKERKMLIEECLKHNIPISDWYPSVLPLFGDMTNLSGVKWHEDRIINFPLLIEDNEIKKICQVINTILKG